MDAQTHSLADWVRLRGGIKISEITHDDTEIRAVCSRAEAGYNLLNSKRGRHLDELTGDAIIEGWIGPMAGHDEFLALLGQDIQAKRSGNDLARVWHFSRDLEDLIVCDEEVDFAAWWDYCGDCCSSCGNPVANWVLLAGEGWQGFTGDGWQDTVCDDCVDMAGKVYR